MSNKVKFCPDCGADLGEGKFCPSCGYDAHKDVYDSPGAVATASPEADYVGFANGQPNPVWDKISPHMKEIGKYIPLVFLIAPIIVCVIYLLVGIGTLILGAYGTYVLAGLWSYILVPALIIVFAFLWVKPKFGEPIMNNEYYKLYENSLNIGPVSLPWMLIFSIILFAIAGNTWWLGWLLFIPAIFIILFGPEPYKWYSGARKAEADKKKAEKQKGKKKKSKKKKEKKDKKEKK